VVFNEKRADEFKKLRVLVFASQGGSLDTNSISLMALKLLAAEICQGKGPSVCALLLLFFLQATITAHCQTYGLSQLWQFCFYACLCQCIQ